MQQTLLPSDKDYWKHIVASNNQFGIDVLKTLAMARPTSNVVLSPTSIFLTACMLYNGAGGNTYSQMAAALNLPKPTEINPWNRQLLNYLVMDKPDHEVSIASALWFGKGVRCHEGFVNNAVEAYSASLYGVDFASPEAVEQINYWAENATKGRITHILDENNCNQDTVLVISNAIYFCAKWEQKFAVENTIDSPFYMVGGGAKSVKMMSKVDSLAYREDDNAQMVKLPYKQSPYFMQLVLPKPGRSFGHCIEYIKNPNVVMNALPKASVALQMPRMEIEFSDKLNQAMSQLGMNELFGDNCDLSLITPDIKVSFINHAAKIIVDESGTEAAAATAAVMENFGMSSNQPVSMTLDRPFLMAIADSGTGQVLFSGAILAP